MERVLVCGHRNPDMDSICSAYAYANLQNQIFKNCEYIPVRCGNLNQPTKVTFEKLGLTPPHFIKDVRTRVSSVVVNPEITIDCKEPIHKLISIFEANDISVVPVTKEGEYLGLLSIDEINRYFLKEVSSTRPIYKLTIDTMSQVMKGSFIKKGEKQKLELPIMVAAMSFTKFKETFDAIDDENLPLLVVGDRLEPILEAIYRQVPLIILTGMSEKIERLVDFSNFKGAVFKSDTHTSETLRLLRLCIPVEDILLEQPVEISYNALFDEAKNLLANSHYRGLPVFEGKHLKGFVTRRCFLERPKTKVVMVDHNEMEQAVTGLEEADIIGIIDHHRFGTTRTANPIMIYASPVGSTCTLVTQLYERYGIEIEEKIARVLLSGLVSDTVILRSPTTTEEDKRIAKVLCDAGKVESLQAFGQEMFESGISISKQDPKSVIEADFKVYKEAGLRLGIGQCEVITLKDFDAYKDKYLEAVKNIKVAHNLDWALFMITDVIKEDSVLLTSGFETVEYKLVYEKIENRIYSLPNVLSRKKQLLPEVIRAIEE